MDRWSTSASVALAEQVSPLAHDEFISQTHPKMTNQLEAAVLVAVLFGAGLHLCFSRRLLRMLFGFLMISNAANLVLMAVSGDPTGKRAAVVSAGHPSSAVPVDPLPQALILTAIVIGFAVAAYLTVLIYRLYTDRGTANVPTLFDERHRGGASSREVREKEEAS
jgi:multicomponent Na+:H+ antiporter subunit C